MTVLWVKRIGRALYPDGDESVSELERLPSEECLRVEVKQPRNIQHHRLYWALCQRIGAAIGADSENVSDVLKIATGHVVLVKTGSYGELKLPKSISFAAMDQAAFKEFFDRCIVVICEEWGMKRDDVMEAVNDLLR